MSVLKNALAISHELVERIVREGDMVVDATAGNGNDTLFLAKLVGEQGHVFCFDIQDIALSNTSEKLLQHNMLERVTLIKDGHEHMDSHVQQPVKAVMFNFGYLPGGDHHMGTKPCTSLRAIGKSMQLIVPGGIIAAVVYHGGDSGFEEKDAIMEYVKTIDNKKYSVLVQEFVNQVNDPPIAVCIERLK